MEGPPLKTMRNHNHGRRELPPLDFEATDFPELPPLVPAGEYLESPIAEAQWEFWNRPWAPTEPQQIGG
jgi:hypothetical protein